MERIQVSQPTGDLQLHCRLRLRSPQIRAPLPFPSPPILSTCPLPDRALQERHVLLHEIRRRAVLRQAHAVGTLEARGMGVVAHGLADPR